MTDTKSRRSPLPHARLADLRLAGRGGAALAVGAVSVVLVQREEGLDSADRGGGGRRGDAGHAAVVRRGLVFRWRFQFSIRSLLVLTVAVAIPCSWLAVEMEKARREREAAIAIKTLGGEVVWSEPAGPPWLRSLLGDGCFEHVRFVCLIGGEVTDAWLTHIKYFSNFESWRFFRVLSITSVDRGKAGGNDSKKSRNAIARRSRTLD